MRIHNKKKRPYLSDFQRLLVDDLSFPPGQERMLMLVWEAKNLKSLKKIQTRQSLHIQLGLDGQRMLIYKHFANCWSLSFGPKEEIGVGSREMYLVRMENELLLMKLDIITNKVGSSSSLELGLPVFNGERKGKRLASFVLG